MELSTARRLVALNQQFYDEHAENFAASRPRPPAGVLRVLGRIRRGARVLEVGCGDGKVGRALAREGIAAYVGVDASEGMLERARRYSAEDAGKRPEVGGQRSEEQFGAGMYESKLVFVAGDLTQPGWDSALPALRFDWVLAFSVMHHLPARALRTGVLKTLAQHLAPGGHVALSNWQFTRSERLKKRIRPWAAVGLDAGQVEPGDYLLAWERKGWHGLRYVHVLDQAEARQMAAEAGLAVVETFKADGVTGDLTDYVVMRQG